MTPIRMHMRGARATLMTSCATLAGLCALAQPVSAQIPTSEPLVVVANTDLFATCTADHVSSQPGTNYPNTHMEPNLAINPANAKNMVVGFHMDRWSNGGARGMGGAYTFDGGKTWKPTSTPNVTQCQGGFWPRSSDPWISFSPDGTSYYSALTTETLENPNLFGRSAQVVSQSLDGGVTWYPPTTLVYTASSLDDTQPQTLHDKNSVTADPANSKLAYVVWDKLTSYTPGFIFPDDKGGGEGDASGSAKAAAATDHDGVSIARRLRDAARQRNARGALSAQAAPAFPTYVTGPTLFARTFNHGYTWEPAKVIYDPGSNNQTIGNQIVTLPDGRLADFFVQINDLTGAQSIGYVASSDKGKTWSKPYFVHVAVTSGAVTPNKQEGIRSADILFSVTVDSINGVIYLAWEDTRFSGNNEIAVAYSQDAYSWTSPFRVNQTPRNPTHPLFQQALIPTVVTTDDGTAVVTYYDFRRDTVGASTDATDYWAVACNPFVDPDGCTTNYSWHREVKLTVNSFDYNLAPVANGHFLGDYMGLKAVGQKVYPVFGQSNSLNKTTLYMRPINVPVSGAPRKKTLLSVN